ncbi:response regulator transcription factor [Candidatus Saccharibacteria bacterium]|nr:response regulator transcription factor [Candidatus Saccharibacteria bacterium]
MSQSVLIVEDDRLLAEVYQKSLRAEGIKSVVTYDFTGAIAKFKSSQHWLVVLDIMLADKNGFELLKSLRRQPGGNRFAVLVVSGMATNVLSINKEVMVALNIIGVYTKSQFSIAQFVQLVKSRSRQM